MPVKKRFVGNSFRRCITRRRGDGTRYVVCWDTATRPDKSPGVKNQWVKKGAKNIRQPAGGGGARPRPNNMAARIKKMRALARAIESTPVHPSAPAARRTLTYPSPSPGPSTSPLTVSYEDFKKSIRSPPRRRRGPHRKKTPSKHYKSYNPNVTPTWKTTGATPSALLASAIRATKAAMASSSRSPAARKSRRVAERVAKHGIALSYAHRFH